MFDYQDNRLLARRYKMAATKKAPKRAPDTPLDRGRLDTELHSHVCGGRRKHVYNCRVYLYEQSAMQEAAAGAANKRTLFYNRTDVICFFGLVSASCEVQNGFCSSRTRVQEMPSG